jgi:hypothetical protein
MTRQRFFDALVDRREADPPPRDEVRVALFAPPRFAAFAPVRFAVFAPARLRPPPPVRDPPPERPRGAAGTSAPLSRASFKPIAMACLRLRTRPPDPLRKVPLLRRRIADATVFDAVDFRFAIPVLLGVACSARMQTMFRSATQARRRGADR